jgi:WD40 repeat protein
MQRLSVHPRPPTEREHVSRSLLMARIPIPQLCDLVEHYAREFQGLRYDASNLFQLQCDQRVSSWLACGPVPTQTVLDIVGSYVHTITPPDLMVASYGTTVCVMPRGELAYWTAEQGLCVWDGRNVKSLRQSLARDLLPSALAALSDGCQLIIGLASGDVMFWDVDAGSRHFLRKIPNVPTGIVTCLVVVLNESSRQIVVAGTSNHEFRAWDAELNVCVWSWSDPTTSSSIFAMAALSNGRFLSGAGNGSVCIQNINGGPAQKFKGHQLAVKALITLREDKIATGSMDRTVRIWNMKDQACLHRLDGHTSVVLSLAELPDDRLASGSFDRMVRVWRVTTGDCLFTFDHRYPILSMVVLQDGRLATCSGSIVHVWDSDRGACQLALKTNSKIVTKLVVLHGGQLVALGNECSQSTWV